MTRDSGTNRKNQNSSSPRGSKQSTGKSRPYRSQPPSWNQTFDPQTANDIFGAFAPNNQVTNSSNNNNNNNNNNNAYTLTKRPIQYEQNPNELYPKRNRTYNDSAIGSQDYYSSNSNHYPAQPTNYNNSTAVPQPPWSYQTDPYYDQQQYSSSEPDYMHSMCMLQSLSQTERRIFFFFFL